MYEATRAMLRKVMLNEGRSKCVASALPTPDPTLRHDHVERYVVRLGGDALDEAVGEHGADFRGIDDGEKRVVEPAPVADAMAIASRSESGHHDGAERGGIDLGSIVGFENAPAIRPHPALAGEDDVPQPRRPLERGDDRKHHPLPARIEQADERARVEFAPVEQRPVDVHRRGVFDLRQRGDAVADGGAVSGVLLIGQRFADGAKAGAEHFFFGGDCVLHRGCEIGRESGGSASVYGAFQE